MSDSCPKKYDLLLTGGLVADADGLHPESIAFRAGKVAARFAPGQEGPADAVIDCSGKYILPGFVDMHFHCRTPGNTQREDFDTATAAAAAGGVTTLVEMPIAKPSPHSAELLRQRVAYASERAVIDFAMYGAGATGDPQLSQELAEAGAAGFKLFLHDMPVGREDEFSGLCAPDAEKLYAALAANSSTGLVTCIHGEDNDLIHSLTQAYTGDTNCPEAHRFTRPPEAEELAILRAGMVAGDARIHICHVSSLEGLNAINYLQDKGVRITAETCPQYLLFDETLADRFGLLAKVNPPLRPAYQQVALWEGLRNGTLVALASDHAPFLAEERSNWDYLVAPSGIPGAELFGPLLIDQVLQGEMDWPELIAWACQNPAEILGFAQKGGLQPGQDGDFLILDPSQDTVVDWKACFSKSRSSLQLFDGMQLRGRIESTWVRGQKVYDQGRITAQQGYGQFVPGQNYKK